MNPRPPILAILAPLALLPALGACGHADAAPGWAGTVDTLASGAVVVHNPRAPLWDSASAWRLKEELRIGSQEGDTPESFSAIYGLDTDALGRIYVLDRDVKGVRVFGTDGRYLRTLGREGGGPGEVRDPVGITFAPDGDLWIFDPGNNRFAVFDTAGRYVTSYPRLTGGYMVPWPGGFRHDGRIYDVDFTAGRPALVGMRPHDGELVAEDTIPIPHKDTPMFELVHGKSRMATSVPYTTSIRWTLDPAGDLWYGDNATYRIVATTASGDTARIIERDFDRLPVTSADRDSAIAQLEWFTKQGGHIDPSKLPAEKPAFGAFFVDPDAYLWVTPVLPGVVGMGGRGAAPRDVFAPDGRYLGRVDGVPARTVVHGDHMLAVVRDEMDIPYVVRYRIVGRADAASSAQEAAPASRHPQP